MKKLCHQLWARQSCERTGERKVEPKRLWQEAVSAGSWSTGSVLITTPSVLISTAVLQVISWGNKLHMPALQSHTRLGRKQHIPIAAQAWPQERGPLPTAGNQQDANKVYMALHESWQIFLKFITTIMILKLPVSKMSSKFHSLEKFSSLLYTENVYKMNQTFQKKSFNALVKLPRISYFLAYWLEHILTHSCYGINSYRFHLCYNAILQKT